MYIYREREGGRESNGRKRRVIRSTIEMPQLETVARAHIARVVATTEKDDDGLHIIEAHADDIVVLAEQVLGWSIEECKVLYWFLLFFGIILIYLLQGAALAIIDVIMHSQLAPLVLEKWVSLQEAYANYINKPFIACKNQYPFYSQFE
jgi:hypothetical protein